MTVGTTVESVAPACAVMEPEAHLVYRPAHWSFGCSVVRLGLHESARGFDLLLGFIERLFGNLQVAEHGRITHAALGQTRRYGTGQDAQSLGIAFNARTRLSITYHASQQIRGDAFDERRRSELLGAVLQRSIPR